MKHLHLCLLWFLWTTAFAQTTPQAVVERMNQSLLSIEKGEYHVVHKSKSFLKSDTNIHAARVRYFKTDGGPGDTLARFVLWPAGKDLMQGSDGEVYFYIGKDSAIAIERVRQKKGLIAYVSRGNGFRAGVLSLPILTNRGHIPVDPESWSAARVGRFVWNDTAFIELYRRRMFPIHMKITPTAKDSMIYTEQWLLYPDTYTPRRICAWADQQDGHVQYDAYDYSPIRLLAPESTFEETYNVAQLLKNGYHVVDIDPQVHKKRVRLALGDSIPDFAVRLETGETLPLFSAFTQRYLVLDFWYRSCGPCNLAMPGLDRTAKALAGKDVAIVGINPIDKQYDALIQQYKRQYGYTFAIAFTERAAAERMRISAYPQIMVVDRETRRVIYLESGYSEAGENQLRERLEILLR